MLITCNIVHNDSPNERRLSDLRVKMMQPEDISPCSTYTNDWRQTETRPQKSCRALGVVAVARVHTSVPARGLAKIPYMRFLLRSHSSASERHNGGNADTGGSVPPCKGTAHNRAALGLGVKLIAFVSSWTVCSIFLVLPC